MILRLLLAFSLCSSGLIAGPNDRAGLFVAVGDGGRRLSSRDGLVWENDQRWSGAHEALFDVAFGAGRFVAVGGGSEVGRVMTTRDGREWKELPQLKDVVATISFGSGRFIAAHGGELLYSTDGETFIPGGRLDWKGSIHPRRSACGDTEAGFRTIILGDFEPTADGRRTAWRGVTGDGTRWEHTELDSTPANDVAYGSGHFVVVGPSGLIESSHDGEAWQRHPIPTSEDFTHVVWTGERFIVSGGKVAWLSPDGLEWKPESFAIPGSLVWAHENWLALGFSWGGGLQSSVDFTTWGELPIPQGQALQAIAFGHP